MPLASELGKVYNIPEYDIFKSVVHPEGLANSEGAKTLLRPLGTPLDIQRRLKDTHFPAGIILRRKWGGWRRLPISGSG